MNYQIAVHTDVGIQKETNQDSCCVKQAATDKGNVLMVLLCDGMGGLAKGEVASASIIQRFCDWFEQELPHLLTAEDPLAQVGSRWDQIIKELNDSIAIYGGRLGIQLGSTISVMLILEDNRFLIGHVGDSRVYLFTEGTMAQLTEDQTVVAREIKLGRLTPEQAAVDPRRNVLLQCVGASRLVDPAFYQGVAAPDQCFLLCSDGFRHVITPEELYNAMAPSQNPDEATMTQHLVELTELNKYRRENDNITAMLIKTMQEV